MKRPPYGLCVPVRLSRVVDGDTVELRLYDPVAKQDGMHKFRVRLIDCWAPEIKGPERARGQASAEFLTELLGKGADEGLTLWVELKGGMDIVRLLTTMGRVLGRLFVGDEEVSPIMVRQGYATQTKS